MRWGWSRPGRDTEVRDPVEALEVVEIVELDADGHEAPAAPARAHPIREPGYTVGHDGTSLAGIWEALAREG